MVDAVLEEDRMGESCREASGTEERNVGQREVVGGRRWSTVSFAIGFGRQQYGEDAGKGSRRGVKALVLVTGKMGRRWRWRWKGEEKTLALTVRGRGEDASNVEHGQWRRGRHIRLRQKTSTVGVGMVRGSWATGGGSTAAWGRGIGVREDGDDLEREKWADGSAEHRGFGIDYCMEGKEGGRGDGADS